MRKCTCDESTFPKPDLCLGGTDGGEKQGRCVCSLTEGCSSMTAQLRPLWLDLTTGEKSLPQRTSLKY